MKKERSYSHTINISDLPEVVRLTEEAKRSNHPIRLTLGVEEAGTLVPPKPARRSRRQFRPLTEGDPLWNIVGMSDREGPTDVSENKHKYLAEAYSDPH